LKSKIKKYLPVFFERLLNRAGYYHSFIPKPGYIKWGDFKSIKPFSTDFGYDRGGPVDRYYIENFLQSESASVKGNVLEVADNAYTLKYGRDKVTKSDVLHVYEGAPGATYIGDLSKADNLPSNHFDCIILTQTLQFIYDYVSALKHAYRMLKKGGTLLITVPGISPIDSGEWGKNWLWSFNQNSITMMFQDLFPDADFTIKTYGNVYAATAFLYGAGINEVDTAKLDYRDPCFDVIVTISLKK